MAKYSLPIVIFTIILFGVSQAALAAIGSSSNYVLEIADISNEASAGSSASYGLEGTTGIMGDAFDGHSSSENYQVCAGYIEESTGVCVTEPPPPPPPPPPTGGTTGLIAGGRPNEETPPALDFDLQPREETPDTETEPEIIKPAQPHGAAEEPPTEPQPPTVTYVPPVRQTLPSSEPITSKQTQPDLIADPTLQTNEEYPCNLEISNEYLYIQKNCWHKNIIEKEKRPSPEKIIPSNPQKCLSYWLIVPYIPLLLLIIFLLQREIERNKKSNNKKKNKHWKR